MTQGSEGQSSSQPQVVPPGTSGSSSVAGLESSSAQNATQDSVLVAGSGRRSPEPVHLQASLEASIQLGDDVEMIPTLKSEEIEGLMAEGPPSSNSSRSSDDAPPQGQAPGRKSFELCRKGLPKGRRVDEQTAQAWCGESSDDSDFYVEDEKDSLLEATADLATGSDMEEFEEQADLAKISYRKLDSSEDEKEDDGPSRFSGQIEASHADRASGATTTTTTTTRAATDSETVSRASNEEGAKAELLSIREEHGRTFRRSASEMRIMVQSGIFIETVSDRRRGEEPSSDDSEDETGAGLEDSAPEADSDVQDADAVVSAGQGSKGLGGEGVPPDDDGSSAGRDPPGSPADIRLEDDGRRRLSPEDKAEFDVEDDRHRGGREDSAPTEQTGARRKSADHQRCRRHQRFEVEAGPEAEPMLNTYGRAEDPKLCYDDGKHPGIFNTPESPSELAEGTLFKSQTFETVQTEDLNDIELSPLPCKSSTFEPTQSDDSKAVTRPRNKFSKFFKSFGKKFGKKAV